MKHPLDNLLHSSQFPWELGNWEEGEILSSQFPWELGNWEECEILSSQFPWELGNWEECEILSSQFPKTGNCRRRGKYYNQLRRTPKYLTPCVNYSFFIFSVHWLSIHIVSICVGVGFYGARKIFSCGTTNKYARNIHPKYREFALFIGKLLCVVIYI